MRDDGLFLLKLVEKIISLGDYLVEQLNGAHQHKLLANKVLIFAFINGLKRASMAYAPSVPV